MNDLTRWYASLINRSYLQEIAVSERVGQLIESYDCALMALRMSNVPLRDREMVREKLRERFVELMTGLLEK